MKSLSKQPKQAIKLTSRQAAKSLPFRLEQHHAWYLWFCQLVNVASLWSQLSTWMTAILALCFCWQALLLSKQKLMYLSKYKPKVTVAKPVSAMLLLLFALSGCIAIAVSANTFGVLKAMVHLLVFAYTLKAFEIKTRKDFYQHILLGLFLLACAFIFEQDIGFSLVILLFLVVNLMVIHLSFATKLSLLKASKTVTTLLLQSALLAIILFLVFPRLAPFWQVPLAKSAKTGLSDVVSPGDIANLTLSSDLAFRANFKGEKIPPYHQRYWRAMTLENYDGKQWSRFTQPEQTLNKVKQNKVTPLITGDVIHYQIIAQASYQPWLYALVVATSNNTNIIFNDDYSIQNNTPVNQSLAYNLSSALNAPRSLSISTLSRQRNLAIHLGSNPKLEQLGRQLKAVYPEPLTLAQAVLTHFRREPFYYTLQPPLLINNSLDQFYFDTQAGFCVHYASSFTYLMRAAGVPARLVTGYLGGEYNNVSSTGKEQGGHLNIYQYDAHAWAEIWVEGVGWHRVDPTAAVDPERVNQGWSAALLAQQSALSGDLISLYQFKQFAWLNTLRLKLDALDYQWTRWVVGYSSEKQFDLLKRIFGYYQSWHAAALISLALMLTMLLLFFYYRFTVVNNKKARSPADKLYYKSLLTLEKQGIKKTPSQSEQQFNDLVAQQIGSAAAVFAQITQYYLLLRYQLNTTEQQQFLLAQLAIQVKKLNALLKK